MTSAALRVTYNNNLWDIASAQLKLKKKKNPADAYHDSCSMEMNLYK